MNLKHRVTLRIFGIDFGDWQTIKNHAWLAIQPILVAVVAVLVAKFERRWIGSHFHLDDREFVITGPLAVLAILHSIIAGGMLVEVVRRHREVTTAIRRIDREMFEDNRCLRLPGFLKFFLGTLSIILVTYVSLIQFHYTWTEDFSVFTVTWVLSMYWVLITELEDPVSGAWFNNPMPEEWLTDSTEDTG